LALARTVTGGASPLAEIALELRAPRLAVALLAGACLAAAGTVLQGAARNPLASPELMGVTGGASRVAVVGLAVTAACTAVTTLLILESEPSASVAIAWLAGSTYASGWHELVL